MSAWWSQSFGKTNTAVAVAQHALICRVANSDRWLTCACCTMAQADPRCASGGSQLEGRT